MTCQVRRPNNSASVSAIASSIIEPIASGSKYGIDPAAVREAAVGVLLAAAGRLHHAVQADEVTEDDPHACSSSAGPVHAGQKGAHGTAASTCSTSLRSASVGGR